MTTATLPTRNEAWGFFGTITMMDHDAQQAWEFGLNNTQASDLA